jgi:beta-galactosidase
VLSESDGADASAVPEDPGEPVLRVNVGSGFRYQAPNGAVWLPDQQFEEGKAYGYVGGGGAVNRGGDYEGTVMDQLYGRERYGMDAYRFDLPPGGYVVRLHFAEGWVQGSDQRVFDVKMNGETVLDGFDIFEEAGGRRKAIHRDLEVEVGHKGLAIGFDKVADNPQVNGIEIFRKQ